MQFLKKVFFGLYVSTFIMPDLFLLMYIEAYFYSYIQDIVFQFARKLKFMQDNYVINFERNCF